MEHLRIAAENFRLDAATHRQPDIDLVVTAAAGNELLELGRTTIHQGGRDLTAHIVTFWHGDSLQGLGKVGV